MTSAATGGLATLARLLRSRHVYGQVIIGAIGTRLAPRARLAAWDKARRLS